MNTRKFLFFCIVTVVLTGCIGVALAGSKPATVQKSASVATLETPPTLPTPTAYVTLPQSILDEAAQWNSYTNVVITNDFCPDPGTDPICPLLPRMGAVTPYSPVSTWTTFKYRHSFKVYAAGDFIFEFEFNHGVPVDVTKPWEMRVEIEPTTGYPGAGVAGWHFVGWAANGTRVKIAKAGMSNSTRAGTMLLFDRPEFIIHVIRNQGWTAG